MLRFLRIRDFALIRELEIEFQPGLTLLTGETGSGKSILVDALGIVIGGRSSQEMVRTGAEAAVIEGVFSLDSTGEIARILEESGVDPGEDSVLVRREISGGRNRIFINNSPATLGLLRTLGERLADIHGQHDRQTLLDLTTHLQWLDRFGNNLEAAGRVGNLYRSVREIASRLQSLKMDEQERLRRMDILRFQVDEITRADLKPCEREDLESEKKILTNRERIFALSTEAYGLLYENAPSLLSQANRVMKILQDLESFDASWAAHREPLQDAVYRLEDLAYAARDYLSGIDFSPERMDRIEQRLSELDKLARKYGNAVPGILAFAGECARQLDELASHDEISKSLTGQLEAERERYLDAARQLSAKRRKDAIRFEREIRREFQALALDRMELAVQFRANEEDPGAIVPGSYGPTGLDRVEFLVAPNRGEEMKPLAKIASGGELSRIMLAIRNLCGADSGTTLVFDEVDAGIGGRVAEAVGRRLLEIARRNQVLCVTHLPQIAAFAESHFSVRKDVVNSRTLTAVEQLDGKSRIEELARMLGGEVITETTRRHAREMLKHAANI